MTYKLMFNRDIGEVNSVTRLSDNALIPFVEGNKDYHDYLDWLEDGNTPEPADELPKE